MTSPLFYRILGDPSNPPLIILHGLLGTSDNWQSLGKAYSEDHCVYLLDQRNHGRSPHFESHDYLDLAADLNVFMDDHGIEKAHILGHSMGGKTALMFAHHHPDRVEKLIIADMAARAYKPHHQAVFEALLSAPIHDATERGTIERHLSDRLKDPSMVGFLMKGLRRSADIGFTWRPHVKVLQRALISVVGDVPLAMNTWPILVIYGGQSNYIQPADLEQFEQACMLLESHRIPEAGHWLHASHPEEFYAVTSAFLQA
ncbi:MAG: alpha/beta fold hydrolase [Bacteroidetes bacterium]|jgi:esterase|nr:alpha/beta fold hydrolase [Bacteroidota bacterium]